MFVCLAHSAWWIELLADDGPTNHYRSAKYSVNMSIGTLKCQLFRGIYVLLVLLRSYYLPPVVAAARAAAVVAQ